MATPIPRNEARFTLGEILACTGGRLLGPLADELEIRGVGTDTRRLRGGEVFVALTGDRFDGHDHLAAAAAAGAALAVVEREVQAPPGITLMLVADTLGALGAIAQTHLERWRREPTLATAEVGDRRILALTGSAGKSTTKEAITALLSSVQPHGVHATVGNLNNLVGVPMTLLGLGAHHRFAVVEMGTNASGEIPALARMVRPDVALVTLIAAAHTEGIGTLEDVAAEKNALFAGLAGPDSIAIGNGDDRRVVAGMMRADAGRRIRYGRDADGGYRILRRRTCDGLRSEVTLARPDGSELTARTPLLGEVGALAVAAAVAAVEALVGAPVDGDQVSRALTTMAGRMQPKRAGSGLLVIDDSYNSNPASARASIETAAEVADADERRLVLVLGEMRELGEVSAREHGEIGEVAAAHGPALVVAVGGDARLIAERAGAAGVEAVFVEDAEAAAELAVSRCRGDDLVLVKGSRGVQTEKVVVALLEAEPSAIGNGAEQRCSGHGGVA